MSAMGGKRTFDSAATAKRGHYLDPSTLAVSLILRNHWASIAWPQASTTKQVRRSCPSRVSQPIPMTSQSWAPASRPHSSSWVCLKSSPSMPESSCWNGEVGSNTASGLRLLGSLMGSPVGRVVFKWLRRWPSATNIIVRAVIPTKLGDSRLASAAVRTAGGAMFLDSCQQTLRQKVGSESAVTGPSAITTLPLITTR